MAFLRYTALRVLIFVGTTAVLYVAGLRSWLLLLVAVLLSGFISIFALRRQRDAASASLSNRLTRINQRLDEQASAEDAEPRPGD